jgi:hypothetical protein
MINRDWVNWGESGPFCKKGIKFYVFVRESPHPYLGLVDIIN